MESEFSMVSLKRWQNSQRLEKEYFDKGKNKQWSTPHSLEYWKKFMKLDDVEGSILEIGCGPNGLWRFKDTVIGYDPIDFSSLGTNFVQGMAEKLPFEDNSFKYVIICNALDHCMDPAKVISEIYRVAPKVVLWTNIFSWYTILVLKLIDPTHPHHFTFERVEELFSLDDISDWYRVGSCYSDTLLHIHQSYTHNKRAKTKLLIASILGTEGLCMHIGRPQ